MTRSTLFASIAALAIFAVSPAHAVLAVGAAAPAIEAKGAEAGKEISYSLTENLKEGPVVLYFYPKANTGGCDLEAKLFGEASAQFKAAGATVVGASGDDVPTLKVYSQEKCASAFPVIAADAKTIDAYDVRISGPMAAVVGGVRSTRTTFVIAPDGKIISTISGAPADHPAKSLEAVKAWKATHKGH